MRNTSALDALFPAIRKGVLAAALTHPGRWWYLSELAKFLHTTPSSLQRELAALVGAGILRQRRDGRRVYFSAEVRSPIFRDLQGLFEKTTGLIATLRHVIDPLGDEIVCAFIYGSIARHREQATSDIDLMVIGNAGLAELAPSLRQAERELGREINVTNYSVTEFRKRIALGHHFLTTVIKGKLQFVKGERRDLDAITRKRAS
jgi:predicted nucleotidyltransferase